jgi:hypothetical protein
MVLIAGTLTAFIGHCSATEAGPSWAIPIGGVRMKKATLILAAVASLWAGSASAMTVQEFLTSASRIPRNPTALLRADTRRLMNETKAAFSTVRSEQTTAQAAGRRPATCMPAKVSLSADALLARFNAIPAARRNISVTQAVREWMTESYPCAPDAR